jgi:hypothetical protein
MRYKYKIKNRSNIKTANTDWQFFFTSARKRDVCRKIISRNEITNKMVAKRLTKEMSMKNKIQPIKEGLSKVNEISN